MISWTRAGSPLAEAPIVTSASAGRASRAEQREQRVAADAEADEHRALEPERAQDEERVEPEADDPELLALVGRAAVAAEVDDDRPVARREPLRDLAPVEGRPCRCRRGGRRPGRRCHAR